MRIGESWEGAKRRGNNGMPSISPPSASTRSASQYPLPESQWLYSTGIYMPVQYGNIHACEDGTRLNYLSDNIIYVQHYQGCNAYNLVHTV